MKEFILSPEYFPAAFPGLILCRILLILFLGKKFTEVRCFYICLHFLFQLITQDF